MFMPSSLFEVGVIAAVSSAALVGLVRVIALRHGVLDHPTERSSHVAPIPRGGGLGLLVAALGLSFWRAADPPLVRVLLCFAAACAVAFVGWVDDRRSLSVRTRLAVHLLAAVFVGLLSLEGTHSPLVAALVMGWWIFWTVSSINLVNFMDGINGLVASQVAVFALSLALFPDPTSTASFYAIAVAAACLGFLPWNFPRARIFLGDVGSGGLGYLVPVLALLAIRGQGVDIIRAHLPLLPLFGDATWTILRRWRNRERLTAPHRTHLYQRLANGGMGHTRVTLLYTAVALCGLLVAHMDRFSLVSPWFLSYLAVTVLFGALLHRLTRPDTRALT
jgi:UDP-N-acetylmuramyl pentapeptide phosphotransferase/UDP-N-acetylglucosamine-1-phosphate transferase